jgi:hypothetical protein
MFSVLSFIVSKSLHLLGQTVESFIFDCLTLKMKALQCFETLVSMSPVTQPIGGDNLEEGRGREGDKASRSFEMVW